MCLHGRTRLWSEQEGKRKLQGTWGDMKKALQGCLLYPSPDHSACTPSPPPSSCPDPSEPPLSEDQGLAAPGRRGSFSHHCAPSTRLAGTPLIIHCVLIMCNSCGPMDCSSPGSSGRRIFQARILEGLPLPTPEDLSNPGIEPEPTESPALGGGFFTTSATWQAPMTR